MKITIDLNQKLTVLEGSPRELNEYFCFADKGQGKVENVDFKTLLDKQPSNKNEPQFENFIKQIIRDIDNDFRNGHD